MSVFRFPCSHNVSITQTATFGYLNPPSKASGIAVALFQKMDVMLDSVGKNVLLKESPEEYENVVNQQEIISFCNSISEMFCIYIIPKGNNSEFIKDLIKKLLDDLIKFKKDAPDLGQSESEIHENYIKFINAFKLEDNNFFNFVKVYNNIDMLYNEINFQKVYKELSKNKYIKNLFRYIC